MPPLPPPFPPRFPPFSDDCNRPTRFRCAVPEELFSGDLAHAIGRKNGLSAEAVEQAHVAVNAFQEMVYGQDAAAVRCFCRFFLHSTLRFRWGGLLCCSTC